MSNPLKEPEKAKGTRKKIGRRKQTAAGRLARDKAIMEARKREPNNRHISDKDIEHAMRRMNNQSTDSNNQ